MNLLLVHRGFPGQFEFLAPALAARGHTVVALTEQWDQPVVWQGVQVQPYRLQRQSTPGIHPWVADFETKVIRGEAALAIALAWRERGFAPDVIVAHPAWGDALFLKDVWPQARLGLYCEFFPQARDAELGFDPSLPRDDPWAPSRQRVRTQHLSMLLSQAVAGLSPTHWQANTFPAPFRERITVVHEGVDTQALVPDPTVRITLQTAQGPLVLSPEDEVISFAARDLEPYRGYPAFMQALPTLLTRRPQAQVLIVGGDGVSYGQPHPSGQSWRDVVAQQVRPLMPDTDWARIHFLGRLPRLNFVRVLQCTRVHVYLSYPFVLSWSLLEAMSVGAALVASDTAPVREVLRDGDTASLVDLFDPMALVEAVVHLLENPALRRERGGRARQAVVTHYDRPACLARQIQWVEGLWSGGGGAEPTNPAP